MNVINFFATKLWSFMKQTFKRMTSGRSREKNKSFLLKIGNKQNIALDGGQIHNYICIINSMFDDDDELLPVFKHVMKSPPRVPESHTSHNISIDSAENVAIGHGSVIKNYYYCPVIKSSEGSQIKSDHELLNLRQRYTIPNQGSPAVNPQTHCTPTKKSRVCR